MIVFIGATILLAEKFAVKLSTGLKTFGLPPALGELLVAVLVSGKRDGAVSGGCADRFYPADRRAPWHGE